MRYLLDTNIWIGILKARNARLINRFTSTRVSDLATCSPVRAELMYGAEKYADADARREEVVTTLDRVISLPFDDRCADQYGLIRHDLEIRRLSGFAQRFERGGGGHRELVERGACGLDVIEAVEVAGLVEVVGIFHGLA